MIDMEKFEYQVSFATPAFLGNAEQNAQWRTPPFKALLRQWWRVAYAAERGFPHDTGAIRDEEGRLFGHAWLEDDRDGRGQRVAARRSLVRIRLDRWDEGQYSKREWGQQDLERDRKVFHPEKDSPVGPLLYLGYGPLEPQRVQSGQNGSNYATVLKKNAAIQAGETAMLSLAVPDEHAFLIRRALSLVDRYGTLGSRSRNGWGSFSLSTLSASGSAAGSAGDSGTLQLPLRDWREALDLDWPHAIGRDKQGPLIWQTVAHDDWKALMKTLAVVKIGLRTQFVFTTGNKALRTEERHWLSYPVTNHSVGAWSANARLPNSLRFKVRHSPADPKKCVGVIFHVPCLPPPNFSPDRSAIIQAWQSVHALLDELTRPAGARGYGSIRDAERREKLKLQLDTITLARVSE